MCSCDVPRDAQGWPTVGPEFFTEAQLRREGERWRGGGAIQIGTIAYEKWELYATELHRRGFVETVDLAASLLAQRPNVRSIFGSGNKNEQ
jgi:hypothetical protein